MAAHSMAALSYKELASPLSLTTLTQCSVSGSAPPACCFAYAPATGRLGDASVSGSTTRSVLWGSGDAKRDACVWGSASSFGGQGFKNGEGSVVAKANPLDEMQGYVEKELRSYTSELHKRTVAGDDSLDSSSFNQVCVNSGAIWMHCALIVVLFICVLEFQHVEWEHWVLSMGSKLLGNLLKKVLVRQCIYSHEFRNE
jgi:hypothetical protein